MAIQQPPLQPLPPVQHLPQWDLLPAQQQPAQQQPALVTQATLHAHDVWHSDTVQTDKQNETRGLWQYLQNYVIILQYCKNITLFWGYRGICYCCKLCWYNLPHSFILFLPNFAYILFLCGNNGTLFDSNDLFKLQTLIFLSPVFKEFHVRNIINIWKVAFKIASIKLSLYW